MADPAEVAPVPEFVIEADDPARMLALKGLEALLLSAPRMTAEAFSLYSRYPEAVHGVVAILINHGEAGLAVLNSVETVWDSQADTEVGFDDATEKRIEDSAAFKLAKDIRDSIDRRDAIRRVRIRTFADLVAASQKVDQEDGSAA